MVRGDQVACCWSITKRNCCAVWAIGIVTRPDVRDCQVDEDLPYILKVAGEDSLMVGFDYTHRDSSMEYELNSRLLKERE
jgi:hypothetical protein